MIEIQLNRFDSKVVHESCEDGCRGRRIRRRLVVEVVEREFGRVTRRCLPAHEIGGILGELILAYIVPQEEDNFADEMDKAASDLKAVSLPRQQTHVLMPLPELNKGEIFARIKLRV